MRFLWVAIGILLLGAGALGASAASPATPDLSAEILGTLDAASGGLSEDMWYGSEGKTILSLLEALPSGNQSPAMQAIMAKLLLTRARPPAGLPEAPSLFELRVQHLMQLGRGKDVAAMLALLPPDKRSEDIEKTEIAAMLYAKQYTTACPKVAAGIQKYKSPFWQQANILCLAVEGKKNEVELAIKLYEELSGAPAVLSCCNIPYRALAELIPPAADSPPKVLPPIKAGNPLELPMLLAAGFAPPREDQSLMVKNMGLLFPMVLRGPGREAEWRPEGIDTWWQAKQGTMPDSQKAQYAIRTLVLMESLGIRLPASAWQPLSVKDIPSPDPRSPLAALLLKLDKAAQEKKTGETILLSLVCLGEEGPGKAHAYTVGRVVRALRRIGQNAAASEIATEAAFLYQPEAAH